MDRLARRLGVTRGVFHWRFAGLPTLLEAVLADRRDTDSVTVLAALEGAGSPRRRFQDLMRVSIEQAGDSPASDRAVRKWWRTDPAVPATVTEVDGRRLAAFETLFRDAGYPPREALPRARISCCDQVGYDALGVQKPREQRWPLGATCRRILTGREGPRPTIQHRVDDDADGAVASPEARGERALSDGSAEHARRLYARALVWDNTFPFGPSCGSEAAHVATLGRMRAAGYSCVSLTTASDNNDMPDAVRKIARDIALFRSLARDYVVVRHADDIPRAKAEGKLAVVFTFQGTLPFERDIALVELFWRLGVRMALLAYNQRNHVADGCHEPADGGLSRFGVEVVREMNRVGMLVDCTHTGYRSSMQAMEVSTSPVVFSHSNPRALVDHERDIRDDQALACARTGGVVGVNAVSLFLGGPPDAATLFRHIDYWVNPLGPEHVGIGLDVVSEPSVLLGLIGAKSADKYPAGQYAAAPVFGAPELLPDLAEEMVRRGWPDAAVEGVLGANWLRVARQVWRDA